MASDSKIRDAASVVLVRDRLTNPRFLAGQRGDNAVFMPGKFVFPGGSVDPVDESVRLLGTPGPVCMERLQRRSGAIPSVSILRCAVREVWEETGLRLAERVPDGSKAGTVPPGWRKFCAPAWLPSAEGLVFFYRAITPPGLSRRFDARFFFGDVDVIPLVGDPDDFQGASGELANLQWVSLNEVASFDFPSITRMVIEELRRVIGLGGQPAARLPFRYEEDGHHLLRYL